MKSLFRTIRRKLLDEGKLLRYLTYALGEIVLIVVGILFALKINDWNEDRKAQSEFNEYVAQLSVDVSTAIGYRDYTKEFMGELLEHGELVVNALERVDSEPEDLAGFEEALDWLGAYNEPQVHVGLLGQLLNGNTEIIGRNRSLAKRHWRWRQS
jgi:hypothetical protein